MKVLASQCDHCGGLGNIILSSKDDEHHLCKGCVCELLEWAIRCPEEEVDPLDEPTLCSFCGIVRDSQAQMTYVEVGKRGSNFWVCASCLLGAARRSGDFRVILEDC